jgi:hypothetical protein
MVLAGAGLLVVSPSGNGVEGFALAAGGGLSVFMINVLYRLGVSGEAERAQEEAARRHFDATGEWPEDLVRSPGHIGSLPRGVVTPEDERGASGAMRSRDSEDRD